MIDLDAALSRESVHETVHPDCVFSVEEVVVLESGPALLAKHEVAQFDIVALIVLFSFFLVNLFDPELKKLVLSGFVEPFLVMLQEEQVL